MHQLNVLILGPSSFISTLNELKPFLKFNPLFNDLSNEHDIILFHKDALKDTDQKLFIDNSKSIKICVSKKKELLNNCDTNLELPINLKEINTTIENIAAKSKFSKNSSIEIKNYLLNKNEKKLSKFDKFVILTEKEIQLLELFLSKKKPISKEDISIILTPDNEPIRLREKEWHEIEAIEDGTIFMNIHSKDKY